MRKPVQMTGEEAAALGGAGGVQLTAEQLEARYTAWLAALPTSEYLARTLEELGLEDLAVRARAHEFHPFLSPHPAPGMRLYLELDRVVAQAEAASQLSTLPLPRPSMLYPSHYAQAAADAKARALRMPRISPEAARHIKAAMASLQKRLNEGEFEATREETVAWARTKEGQKILSGLPIEIRKQLCDPNLGVGRNSVCPCGSGKKFKRCCGDTGEKKAKE